MLQVSRPTKESVSVDGVIIVYTSAGHQYRKAIRFGMGLCVGDAGAFPPLCDP
jgi:hypothetical protein